MSWDITIQDIPQGIQAIDEIPDDFQPKPLGPRRDLITRIHQIFPDADFSDPSWGLLDRPRFSIEFSMGTAEICDSFALHVRGGGDAVARVAQLLNHLGLRGIDLQVPDFFSVEAAEGSFREWQAYRDRSSPPNSSNTV